MDPITEEQAVSIFNLKDMFYTIRNMNEEGMEWLINDLIKNNPDWDVHDAKGWIGTVMACMENILLDSHAQLEGQSGEMQYLTLSNYLYEEKSETEDN